MPYTRIVFEKLNGDGSFDHVGFELSRVFDEVWKEFKRDEVKAKDFWMKVEDPTAKLEEFATKVVGKAKTKVGGLELSHAVGNGRSWIFVKNGKKLVPVGKLLFGDAAFPLVPLPGMGAQAVVQRKGGDKEFVFDDYGQLTQRYVYRFVTSYDESTLKQRQGLKSRDATASDNVYSHVAGKVNSRFISTTRSSQPIQNAHGEVFGTKRVKIDLSVIPRQHIYDVSTPEGEVQLLKGKQGTQGNPNSFTTQVQQALKDAKRTKEVLIENEIPHAAIVETAGFTVTGIPRNDPQ